MTHVLAGPFASYQLGILGAEVIKVESPHSPDQARMQGADWTMNDRGWAHRSWLKHPARRRLR